VIAFYQTIKPSCKRLGFILNKSSSLTQDLRKYAFEPLLVGAHDHALYLYNTWGLCLSPVKYACKLLTKRE
jgi:hypothetical protein